MRPNREEGNRPALLVFPYCLLPIACCLLSLLPGCSAGTATISLIDQAARGIDMLSASLETVHAQQLAGWTAQEAALDAAFDADLRLAEAGKITDADGKPVALTAAWVISARKGYVAGRTVVAANAASSERAHAVDRDNAKASKQALVMARTLAVMSMNISENLKGWLTTFQGVK
jgi:hypothetical protein